MPDTPDEGVQEGTTESADAAGSGEPKGSEPFFVGKYKTREDAERGLAEKDATVSRFQSELDKLKAENQKLNSDVLKKLADAVAAKSDSHKRPQADIDAELERMAAEIDSGGGKGVLKVLGAYLQDTEQRVERNFRSQLDSLREQELNEIKSLRQSLMERDPQFQARRPIVEKLESEFGLDREKAMKMAALFDPNPTFPLPGGTQTKVTPSKKSDDDIDVTMLESEPMLGKITEAEKKALAKRMSVKRGGRR